MCEGVPWLQLQQWPPGEVPYWLVIIITLRPRQDGRHFLDDIFICIFLNENEWHSIKISLKFVPKVPINNIPALVQIMAWRRPGDKPLSEPMMVVLPTQICVTRPQWVKGRVNGLAPKTKQPTWYYQIYKNKDLCNRIQTELSSMSKSTKIRFPWSWNIQLFVVRRAGLLWSQRDFVWRWSVPLFKCLTVLEFSFILFDLCLLITFFNFIMNYVPIVTFWIFTYHKIWILSIMFCSIWSYWIIYFLACLEVSWRVVS